MVSNQFFVKQGPFSLKKIINLINSSSDVVEDKKIMIADIKDLYNASKNDITFLNSKKYKESSLKTNATACITSSNFANLLPKKCIKLYVKNVLLAVTQVSKIFYPSADIDYPDQNLIDATKFKKKYPSVLFGKNVLIGKNVSIGKNSRIGSNTIIESHVKIGKNCFLGSFVMIKNSQISDNVLIQDGCKIGIKGFGFIPNSKKNIRTPHTGKVMLHDGVEIGANCTIDRGSLSNTIIGENTFLDNQVHVAHNVKIGKNCMIAGQVGFAGSSTLGDNVIIGGQAGVSGHLKIGNNVKIGGGSGVVNDLPNNSQVMGYPAIPIREFAKLRKKYER